MGNRWRAGLLALVAVAVVTVAWPAAAQAETPTESPVAIVPMGCEREISAEVAAIDQPFFWNRLGAAQPQGQIYALTHDLVAKTPGTTKGPGNALLRSDKRPRPLVLRMNVGDCLTITFHNWLDGDFHEQPVTRDVSIHVTGMQLSQISDDGSWVGKNPSSLVSPGGTATYRIYAEREGTYLLHTGAPLTGGPQSDNGSISTGLFGAVNVEPRGSVWYRSQVSEADLELATRQMISPATVTGGIASPAAHGYPVIDYAARYPSTTLAASSKPILQMLDPVSNEIVYSDLTAIVVPRAGTYRSIGVSPKRDEPFREFTIIFHDEIGAVQAFPHFYDGQRVDDEDPDRLYDQSPPLQDYGLAYTLHSVRDAFAVNYGTGGIGAEILANRLGVGPMHECVNCRFEEFFLSAWAVGDPAMVVDVPANAPCTKSQIESGVIEVETNDFCVQAGPKATKAFYPDDPSNVYHSYLNDHVKFRNLLAGSDDHHIFHLHAHQWLHTPDSDNSTYLDSQAIGQGASFTYEIAHEGSGNRNKTPGDSIFHCHFYPHFAQGMWGMWRVHDVLELGTPIGEDGRPLPGSRALPDGEIAAGTPIPGLVPLPGQPMPPPPSVQVAIVDGQVSLPAAATGNPGYPFWVPGKAGQRAPTPPMDVYVDANGVAHDGGLPRLIVDGGSFIEYHTRFNFEKELTLADAFELDEHGEPWELAAMDFHADHLDGMQDGFITTVTPSGATGKFEVNGSDPVAGAPYAEPCYRPVDGYPNALRELVYKAANIQMDVVFNKKGWHFPQQRFLSLWEDVDDFQNRSKPPEPLFIRANSRDCVTYLHTNLVPKIYEMDDFQVRTPTDILGQHIHLVKFDVTSSDGSANGFNYEDGTLSPHEVVDLIGHINDAGGIRESPDPNAPRHLLQVENHPFFGVPGAQTTVQRWFVDPVINNGFDDRTLRTVFTHDHFGPSTHQQVGLYGGLITELKDSLWYHGESGDPLGFDLAGNPFRHDGGPTSWQAVIEGPDSFREFALEFGDFQHAYTKAATTYPNPHEAINPPGREEQWTQLQTKPWIYEKPALVGRCPNGLAPPCPEAIAADDPGTMVVNYRNEPIALRVKDPGSNQQAAGQEGDLSWAFASIPRADTDLNVVEPNYSSTLTTPTQLGPYDAYTPMLRAYEDDHVRLRVLVGAHEEEHNFSIHGTRWLFEPSDPNSGIKASQMMGISEFYDFELPPIISDVPATSAKLSNREGIDFLWKAGSSAEDLWNGIWGLMRVYRGARPDLRVLSSNPDAAAPEVVTTAQLHYNGPCPKQTYRDGKVRYYDVVAVQAADVLPEGQLNWNDRMTLAGAPLNDPTAIMFVHRSDLVADAVLGTADTACNFTLRDSAPREPLILRAAAGECVEVKLTNCLPAKAYDALGYSLLPNVVDEFNQNQVNPSEHVGLHAQLVSYDITSSDALNVGRNPVQTAAPGQTVTYQWYAGVNRVANGTITSIPVEFGSVPLYSSDPIEHSSKGAVGALVVEPENSTWVVNARTRAQALVSRPATTYQPAETFREQVLVFHDDVNLQYGDGTPVRPLIVNEDPAETGQDGVNYRTEPVWFREQYPPETMANIDFSETFANSKVGGDPKTPVFHAVAGEPIRLRVVHPGGDGQAHTFGLHGHVWQEEPYIRQSRVIGNNPLSEWKGVQYGHGPTNAFDVVPQHGAGGINAVTGDFMWRDYVSWYLANGIWGLVRVHDSASALSAADPGWMTLTTRDGWEDGGGEACTQVITYAQDPATGECVAFPTPCDVPDGWAACEPDSAGPWEPVAE